MNYNDLIGNLRKNSKLNIDVRPKCQNQKYVQFDYRCGSNSNYFHSELDLTGTDLKGNRCIFIETHFEDGFMQYADFLVGNGVLIGISSSFGDRGIIGNERRIRYDKPIACTFDPNGEIDIAQLELDNLMDAIIEYKRLTDDILWRLFEMLVRH